MTEPHLRIGEREVGGRDFYVIAEIGVNHEGSLALAKELIDLAHQGGAHAAKFQTYKADKLASRHSPAYWDTAKEPTLSQHALFQKYDGFGPDEYLELAQHCRDRGVDFLSTPFDLEAVEFLAPLMHAFKIASADLTNVPMLRAIAAHRKPVILSTGASTLAEIDLAMAELRRSGVEEIALLHCVLNYPTRDPDAHLRMILGLRHAYPDVVVGYSDHTLPDEGMTVLTSSYLLGARIIEKHFTHDKTLPGNDHYHAMDSADLRRFVDRVERLETLLGPDAIKAPIPSEQPAREHARRSIVVARPVRTGEPLSPDALTTKRPGHGISPLHWDEVVGRPAARDLDEDQILMWSDVQPA